MQRIRKWFKGERGFEVFEGSTLAIGGFIVAMFIGIMVLSISATEYTRVENEVIGNAVEANSSVYRFR